MRLIHFHCISNVYRGAERTYSFSESLLVILCPVILASFIKPFLIGLLDVLRAMTIIAYTDDVMPTAEFTAFAHAARVKAQREWKREDAAASGIPLAPPFYPASAIRERASGTDVAERACAAVDVLSRARLKRSTISCNRQC
jgi:hypothetical protein